MIAPTIMGLTTVCISILSRSIKPKSFRLLLVFTPVYIFLAFRHNYGNDYAAYLEVFNEVANLYEINYDSHTWHAEIGWIYLNRIFIDYGFFALIMFLAFINCFIYARFISNSVPEKFFWLGVFLYIFVPENMLVQSSAMRQSVAILLFLISFQYIESRNFFRYLLLIGLASLFHTSAIFLIPVYFIKYIHFENTRRLIPIFLILYGLLFVYSSEIVLGLHKFLFLDWLISFERYAFYEEKGSVGSGFGFVFSGIYLALLLFYYNQQSENGCLVFKMVIVSIFLIPLSVEILMLSRVGFYFNVFSIVAVPLIAMCIRSNLFRFQFIFIYIAYVLLGYFRFFESPVWRDAFYEYQTIFDIIFY